MIGPMLEPAQTIITLCGGFAAVAEVTGRSEGRVRRWTYTVERGGTGGLIPAEIQQILMRESPARGWGLRPEHFFPEFAPPQKDVA